MNCPRLRILCSHIRTIITQLYTAYGHLHFPCHAHRVVLHLFLGSTSSCIHGALENNSHPQPSLYSCTRHWNISTLHVSVLCPYIFWSCISPDFNPSNAPGKQSAKLNSHKISGYTVCQLPLVKASQYRHICYRDLKLPSTYIYIYM